MLDDTAKDRSHLSKGDPRVADFNAVAQGYTVDGLAEVLQMEGVAHAMVELGGEVKCWGLNPRASPGALQWTARKLSAAPKPSTL